MPGRIKEILQKYNCDSRRMMEIVADIQAAQGYASDADTQGLNRDLEHF